MLWVIGAALLLSLADAIFLLVVAAHIGALPTIGLVVLTALLGMMLVRSEGRTTLGRIQQRLAHGEPPTDELLDGALILLGAGFLITPIVRLRQVCEPFCGSLILLVAPLWQG